MPGAIALAQRRFLGALAYASDSAELSFERLKDTARKYRLPVDGTTHEQAGWTPRNRLSIINDAWVCIDHLNRARRLVQKFPQYGDPTPQEVALFIEAAKPAYTIRNRIQHLDDDIFKGENCGEGHPVLGAVSWADTRMPKDQGHVRYSISSGPAIDGGSMSEFPVSDVDGTGDVVDFRLMAADQTVRLDEMMKALADFISAFEVTVSRALISGLRDFAAQKGVPLDEPRPHGVADMTFAVRMRRTSAGSWETRNGDGFGHVEVAPGFFDISRPPP